MLLALDVGNTNITFGLFRGRRLIRKWRCPTDKTGGLIISRIGRLRHLKPDGIIVSSVVPEIDRALRASLKKKFGVTPLFVTHKNAGIKIGYPRPKEIGADRLVDAVAAWDKYRTACIIIDFGTATTLDYVDSSGSYRGGSIAPGINLASKALYDAASKLPRIRIRAVRRMLPRSTVEAMQSGVYQGYIGLVERLARLTIKETGSRPKIIATGGLAPLIIKGMELKAVHEPDLTLNGLQRIWSRVSFLRRGF